MARSPTKRPSNASDLPASAELAGVANTNVINDKRAEELLLSGERSGVLDDYFGAAQHDELRRLARQLEQRGRTRSGDRVLILPGIMGSKIGYSNGIFGDLVRRGLARTARTVGDSMIRFHVIGSDQSPAFCTSCFRVEQRRAANLFPDWVKENGDQIPTFPLCRNYTPLAA